MIRKSDGRVSDCPVYETYNIDWFTIDGGGGLATGGSFSLNGTVGQPDAGAMSGGVFTVTGGF